MIEINSMFILYVVLSVILITAYPVFLNDLIKNRRNPNKLLIGADKAFAKGKLKKSAKKYKKIIQLLWNKEAHDILGRAHLGMARVSEGKDNSFAINHYILALKNSIIVSNLPETAIILVANSFCRQYDKSEIAIQVYLEVVRQVSYNEAQEVYSLLKRICRMNERTKPSMRQRIITLNKKVISVRNDIEWAHYYLGLAYLLEGDANEAVSKLKRSRDINPQKVATYYWLLKSLLQLHGEDSPYQWSSNIVKLIREIDENARKYFSLIPDDKEGYYNQAEIYFEIGKLTLEKLGGFSEDIEINTSEKKKIIDQATIYFEKAASLDERSAEYLFYLGRIYSLNNKTQQAIESFLNAIKLDESQKEYFYYLANEYFIINSFHDSKINLKKALFLDNNYVEVIALISKIFYLNKEYDEVENHCYQWIRVKGYNFQNLQLLIPALYYQNKYEDASNLGNELQRLQSFKIRTVKNKEIIFCIANSYLQLVKYDRAIYWFTDLVVVDGTQRNFYHFGCALANKGDYDIARHYFDKVIDLGGEFTAKAFLQRGHIHLKTGKLKESETDYTNAYEIDPGNADLLYAIGCLHNSAHNVEEALAWFSKSVEADSANGLYLFGLGLMKEKQGKTEEALKEYERALYNGQDSLAIKLRLGILNCRKSNYRKALEYFENATKSESDNPTLLFYMGMALTHCKQYDEALRLWNKLLSFYPDDTRLELNIYKIHYLLGIQHIDGGRFHEAISEWEQYLSKYDTDDKTKKDLAQLYFKVACGKLSNNGDTANMNEIKELFKRAQELDKDNEIYNFFIAISDLSLGDYSNSINNLNNLNEIQPDNARIKYHLGLALLRKGETEKAYSIFKDIFNNNGENKYKKHAQWIVANEYIKEGKYDEAIPLLVAMQ